MKTTFFTLAAAGFVAAQDFGGQPDCAIECLKIAIPEVGCSLDDTACQCDAEVQARLIGEAGPCLLQTCSPEEVGAAQEAAGAACAAYSATATGEPTSVTDSVSGSMTIVTESSGTESSGTESSGTESSGTESSGTESSGTETQTETSTDSAGDATTATETESGAVTTSTGDATQASEAGESTADSGNEASAATTPATPTETGAAAALPVSAGLLAILAALAL